ncbi:MAG: energy transducer TonB, partial [Bdellovibrio sp.]
QPAPSTTPPKPTSIVKPSTPPAALTSFEKNLSKAFAAQSKNFEKCQIKSLRSQHKGTGQVLVGFTALPSGHIKNVYVIQSSVQDKELIHCTLKTMKKIRLPSFSGDPIQSSLPIIYN